VKDLKKTAEKTNAMKIKSNSKGDTKIPPEKRFYLEVIFPIDSKQPSRYMFFNVTNSIGKVLDIIADTGGIENLNNKAGAEKLYLFSKDGEPLDNDATLNDLSGKLKSGDCVLLETAVL